MTQKRDSKTGRYTFSKEAPPTATQKPSPTKTRSSNEILALTAKPKTVTVDARKGEHVIPTHKITKATRWVYRNGQCFALAVVLAEQNNTDVGLFVQFSELPWGTRYEELDMMPNVRKDWFNHARHAIALTEDSTSDDTFILDIDGKQSMSTVRKVRQHKAIRLTGEAYSFGTMIRIKPKDLKAILANLEEETYKQDYESAALIALLVPKE